MTSENGDGDVQVTLYPYDSIKDYLSAALDKLPGKAWVSYNSTSNNNNNNNNDYDNCNNNNDNDNNDMIIILIMMMCAPRAASLKNVLLAFSPTVSDQGSLTCQELPSLDITPPGLTRITFGEKISPVRPKIQGFTYAFCLDLLDKAEMQWNR